MQLAENDPTHSGKVGSTDPVGRLIQAGLPSTLPAGTLSFFRSGEKPRPEPAPGLAPGKTVGDFRLIALIGQGGMGQVWEAEQLSLGKRHVAVKFVRPERVTAHQLELFAREARAGGRLHHPGIVTVHGHGESDGLAWIALEFVSGAWTLKDFLDEVARAPEVPAGYDRDVARFVAEIADAMQAAHDAGVIHRDLKPQNVLIASDDHPKVTDFGLARITDETALSVTGDFAGTYFYMSPEQVAARRAGLDHRTDVFSLGILLYELLALQRPFHGDTSHQVAAQILAKDPPDIRAIRSRVPRDLAVIAGKALEKDRDKRFQTMREFAADLRRHLADEPIHARPPTRLDRTLKWVKRNPAKSSVAAIAVVTFSVITWLLLQNVRTNRALTTERTSLANANQALEAKTAEAESSALDARNQAQIATDRAGDVFRLSALQQLEDLTVEADRLWPAFPENVGKYQTWLEKARKLVDELPEHEQKLAELRAKAVPWTEEELRRQRANHPLLGDLERARRHAEYLQRLKGVMESGELPGEPSAQEVGLDPRALPEAAGELIRLAWPLVAPERNDWGGEAQGLVLARHAAELASDAERPRIRDTLAWALFANGRSDDALAESERALEEAGAAGRQEFQGYLDQLTQAIEERTSPEWIEREAKELGELEQRIATLEAEVSRRPEWRFAAAADHWWHDQLEKLVTGIRTFADQETGQLSAGTSEEHGWGVVKRLEFASTIERRSLNGSEAATKWSEALASIANETECPQYHGLRISPQLGLLPIGRDPHSDLWEFAQLQTGEPPARGLDGKLVLTADMGLVFVLLPGGTFFMGAQSQDPQGRNFDPLAQSDEAPVHEVTLSPFFLSKYEMTQGQWLRFVGKNPSYASSPTWRNDLSRSNGWSLLQPVEQVRWPACMQVMRRLGLQLPSEAQWEYGARGGTDTPWWCGDDKRALATVGNVCDLYARDHGGGGWGDYEDWDDGNAVHARVGSYPPNPFGLHEVIGNVWEWCRDTYDIGFYRRSPRRDPLSDGANFQNNRVMRGGGFNELAGEARSAFRSGITTEAAAYILGLRPALDITTP